MYTAATYDNVFLMRKKQALMDTVMLIALFWTELSVIQTKHDRDAKNLHDTHNGKA